MKTYYIYLIGTNDNVTRFEYAFYSEFAAILKAREFLRFDNVAKIKVVRYNHSPSSPIINKEVVGIYTH